ncbi:integrase core domain-containing protein [Bifidobacterium avesanii]|uniref:integrase core domain-containing protein n=1 Tax=Bifidobacterium avesanii TaxID=1798157 RepID=UPI0013865305|nr:integrase core domain-containing protein [Bifidobacterium avesanii]KAB8287269.1 integrase [Bifidobacterium avesanii]
MRTIEESFHRACSMYGIPASTLTDNGSVYTTRMHSAEPGGFERTLALMGVRRKNGSPYHPQTQGKIERWHRTLKKWLAARPLAADLDALNKQLDAFGREYNEERPHRALGRRTPREAYEALGKAGPDPGLAAREQAGRNGEERRGAGREAAGRPVRRRPGAGRVRPVDMTVPAGLHRADGRGCVVRASGGGVRRIVVNIGKENAGRTVERGIERGVVTVVDPATGEVLAEQALDPARGYQRRRPSPGVNDAPRQM